MYKVKKQKKKVLGRNNFCHKTILRVVHNAYPKGTPTIEMHGCLQKCLGKSTLISPESKSGPVAKETQPAIRYVFTAIYSWHISEPRQMNIIF